MVSVFKLINAMLIYEEPSRKENHSNQLNQGRLHRGVGICVYPQRICQRDKDEILRKVMFSSANVTEMNVWHQSQKTLQKLRDSRKMWKPNSSKTLSTIFRHSWFIAWAPGSQKITRQGDLQTPGQTQELNSALGSGFQSKESSPSTHFLSNFSLENMTQKTWNRDWESSLVALGCYVVWKWLMTLWNS